MIMLAIMLATQMFNYGELMCTMMNFLVVILSQEPFLLILSQACLIRCDLDLSDNSLMQIISLRELLERVTSMQRAIIQKVKISKATSWMQRGS